MYTTFVIQKMSFNHCRILFVRNEALLNLLTYFTFGLYPASRRLSCLKNFTKLILRADFHLAK